MKKFINENGNVFKYDENRIQSVISHKTGNAVYFNTEEVLNFILESKLWDGYYQQLFKDQLNIKSWIQYMKLASKWSVDFMAFVGDGNGSYLSDFDVAMKIRNMIDNGIYNIAA